jgi:hypothetical protein
MLMSGALTVGKSPYEWITPIFAGVDDANGKPLYKSYRIRDGVDEQGNTLYKFISNPYLAELEAAAKGEEIEFDIVDTYEAAEASNVFTGKLGVPDLAGGFGIDLTVYGFDLSASFMYGIGGYGADNTYASLMHSDVAGKNNWHKDMFNAWTPENKTSDIPRLSNGEDRTSVVGSDRFLTSNTYLSLSNVRLGYSFPKKWTERILLNNLNIWVSGDNLFCLSARKGYIPFASFDGTTSISQYTPLSTVMCGIKFQF